MFLRFYLVKLTILSLSNSTHQEIYDAMVNPLIDQIFQGFNATVFAYGQTGSGKTFTMGNVAEKRMQDGITPFVVEAIFEMQSQIEVVTGAKVDVHLSYMEVYFAPFSTIYYHICLFTPVLLFHIAFYFYSLILLYGHITIIQ